MDPTYEEERKSLLFAFGFVLGRAYEVAHPRAPGVKEGSFPSNRLPKSKHIGTPALACSKKRLIESLLHYDKEQVDCLLGPDDDLLPEALGEGSSWREYGSRDKLTIELEAFEKSIVPFRDFMMRHVREQDLILFVDIAKISDEEARTNMPMRILIPAFLISELRRAFEIGFLIFVPFLIIDMVVSSVLMAMGMMMLPPIIIALPFKIIFFVLIDGWYLTVGSLVRSFGG